MSCTGKTTHEGGRTARYSFAEGLTPTGKARTHRGASGQKLQALPSGYNQSKENAGPSILKRADGQMVKLACIDCWHENFGSMQGFINYCRIDHRQEFKSHKEAAIQSGVPIELDEAGGSVGEEKAPSVATGLVHPLIRDAPTDRAAYTALLSRINDSLNMFREGKPPGVISIPGPPASTPHIVRQTAARNHQTPPNNFVALPQTPFLSTLLKSRGFDGNLAEIVGEAKKVVDFEDFSYSDESDSKKQPDSTQRSIAGFDGSSDSPVGGTDLKGIARMPYSN
jgi:ADA HAT complex component 1